MIEKLVDISGKLDLLIKLEKENLDQELFITKVNDYLAEIEDWQITYKSELDYLAATANGDSVPENSVLETLRPQLKSLLEKIGIQHNQIFERTKDVLGDVEGEMGKVNKSSKVIKRYLDIHSVATLNVKKKG